MAKVQFGGGVSNIQGSIAGNTFTRSKAGPAARNRVKPNNPATPAQMMQRERITRLSKDWQGLTEEQRTSWTEAAKEQKTKGVCGNNIELTGHQYFVRVNSLRESNGDNADSAVIPAAAEFTADIFSTDGAQVDITGDYVKVTLGTGAAEGQRVAIWATAARSAGKMAYKGVMKKTYEAALTADDITNTYVDMVSEWKTKFGALTGTEGKAITFGSRQYIDGQYSNSVISKAVITES
jgi:hypothetical protein|tara:strand:+ start:2555 stop:3265 length:711 start_codon:yes stop_codon:yes gene_type:complete